MNIIFLSDSTVPSKLANSIQIMKMCQAFKNNKNNIKLIATKGYMKDITDDYLYYDIKNKFEIIKIEYNKINRIKYYINLVRILNNLKKSNEIDIIYSRSYIKSFIASFFKYPIIMEYHEAPHDIIQKCIMKYLLKKKKIIKNVFISRSLAHEYKKLFKIINKHEIIIAPDGADVFNINIERKFNKKKKIVVGYTGHLYPGKGIEIIKDLPKYFKHIDFHVVGGREIDLIYWKEKIPYDNIYFHGHVSHSEIKNYLLSFDILLAPYQQKATTAGGKRDISKWMSPLKLFEYMVAGKPIICSDLPVLKEIMINELNCLLVKCDDVSEWKKALKRLIDDHELRLKLGNNARKIFLENYTWDKRVQKIMKGIEEDIKKFMEK